MVNKIKYKAKERISISKQAIKDVWISKIAWKYKYMKYKRMKNEIKM